MHGNVPVRFGRERSDSLGNKGLATYLLRKLRALLLKIKARRLEVEIRLEQAKAKDAEKGASPKRRRARRLDTPGDLADTGLTCHARRLSDARRDVRYGRQFGFPTRWHTS